jgi:hypothetical protein
MVKSSMYHHIKQISIIRFSSDDVFTLIHNYLEF